MSDNPMKPQECLSLAIQALFERKAHLEDILLEHDPNAVKQCMEAIAYLEGIKVINQLVNGFKDCNFELHLITPCSDEDGSEI